MAENHPDDHRRRDEALSRRVGAKEARKLRARRRQHSIWFGLGMFGLVGWSVTIPTLLGLALGLWIDATWPSPYSWTLMLLVAGILLGCWNAWFWVSQEQVRIQQELEELPPEETLGQDAPAEETNHGDVKDAAL